MNTIPIVKSNGMLSDIFSSLLDNRIVTVYGEITDETAMIVNSELMYLASQSDDDIQLFISSPGGSVSAGLSIYDVMQRIKPDVATIASGCVASMAAVILSGGAQGKRFAEKHAEIMIHQPSSGISGRESDIRIAAEHISRLKAELNHILSTNCDKPIEVITQDTERDYWLNSEEACEYGIIDKVLR